MSQRGTSQKPSVTDDNRRRDGPENDRQRRRCIRMASSLVIRALIAATRCKQRVILFVSGSVSFSNFVPFDKQFGKEEGIFLGGGGLGGEEGVCEVLAANDSVTPV